MKPILITGATGFLGKHLVERLKEHTDAPLRLLCRGACPWDSDPRIEVVRGDVLRRDDVARAMKGVGQVYHLAGIVSRDPKDKWLLYQAHIDGTRNVCESALAIGSPRVLVASSSGTIAVSREPNVHTEKSGYKHDVVGGWAYYLSKIYTEKLALHYFHEYKLPVVIVNPALLLGPGDDRGSSTGDVELFLKGGVLAIPLGGMSFVDVRDVAPALIAAMDRGRPGERYLLGGPNWTFRKVIEVLSQVSGIAGPKMRLPFSASLWSARLLRSLFPLVGKSFEGLDDDTIRMSALYWYCDSSKAKSELGFESRDPVVTMRETVEDIRRRWKTAKA